ncbi:hypothetical protein vBAbaMPhT2_077 [Acinetobacter phage vB_AbaM_PhT2]|uniref:Uncharacterized protein n=1 Tax=Acinetobacter phage vB_AbaM_PhT2 TaxID=2690230 RepID=A0A6B9SXS4_9CAUD|nr:hypothetical protein HYQ24_gp077 [Acinetobacter phage vB_AbaM_PhT2]QHJ75689.1 hypothetical protein vBAbaMPhT2_077 [Acinetobacter phage vB_AbaM_PhT2]
MSKFNLVTGLENMIAQVEVMPQDTVFRMDLYKTCVIGKTVGWSKDAWGDINESATIRKLFGIKKSDAIWKLFSGGAEANYVDRTWKVIRLFTGAIGEVVSRDVWLKLAKSTLEEVKNEKQTKSNS